MVEQVYLITGANRGLGLEFTRQITTSSPTNIVIACVRALSGELEALKALHSKHTSQIHILECNTASVDSIRKCGEEVDKFLNGRKLTYLLNNAGINAVPMKTALTMTPGEVREHIDVNVIGPAELVKAAETHLGEGSVVMNMSSGLGSVGKGTIKCTAYAISKCALNMLTAHQASLFKSRGVRVIVMDPGWVQTRMGGEGAILTPEESISGMLKVLHSGAKEDSGSFYQYDGQKVPW